MEKKIKKTNYDRLFMWCSVVSLFAGMLGMLMWVLTYLWIVTDFVAVAGGTLCLIMERDKNFYNKTDRTLAVVGIILACVSCLLAVMFNFVLDGWISV